MAQKRKTNSVLKLIKKSPTGWKTIKKVGQYSKRVYQRHYSKYRIFRYRICYYKGKNLVKCEYYVTKYTGKPDRVV